MPNLINGVGVLLTFLSSTQQPIQFAGSGFLIEYKDSYYIATAKHCIDNFDTDEFCFKINCSNKNNSKLKNVMLVLKKEDFIFSSDNTDSTCYDIALCRIKGKNNIFGDYLVEPIKFPVFNSMPKFNPNDKVITVGYPQNSMDLRELQTDTLALHPVSINGEVLPTPPFTGKVSGIKLTVNELWSIGADSSLDMSGASDGLIMLMDNSHYYPIGILSGAVSQNIGGQQYNLQTFTHIYRLYQMLDSLK